MLESSVGLFILGEMATVRVSFYRLKPELWRVLLREFLLLFQSCNTLLLQIITDLPKTIPEVLFKGF